MQYLHRPPGGRIRRKEMRREEEEEDKGEDEEDEQGCGKEGGWRRLGVGQRRRGREIRRRRIVKVYKLVLEICPFKL